MLKMKRHKDLGSTANQSKRRNVNGCPAPANVPERSGMKMGGSRLQPARSASRARKVTEIVPSPQESSPKKGSQTAQTSINDLPPENLIEIFQHLNVKGLCSLWLRFVKSGSNLLKGLLCGKN
jgi:hypothetical protein